jgi:hypothetical protein
MIKTLEGGSKSAKDVERRTTELKATVLRDLELLRTRYSTVLPAGWFERNQREQDALAAADLAASNAASASTSASASATTTATTTQQQQQQPPQQDIPASSVEAQDDELTIEALPQWRQRVFTIPSALLLALKKMEWPESMEGAYDNAPLLSSSSSSSPAGGASSTSAETTNAMLSSTHWTEHVEHLSTVLQDKGALWRRVVQRQKQQQSRRSRSPVVQQTQLQ